MYMSQFVVMYYILCFQNRVYYHVYCLPPIWSYACCTLYVFHRQSISCVHLLRKRPLSVSVVNFSLPLLLLPSLVYLFAVVSTVFLLVFFDIGICLLCIPSAKIALASIKPPSNAFSSTQLNSSSTVLKIPAFRWKVVYRVYYNKSSA